MATNGSEIRDMFNITREDTHKMGIEKKMLSSGMDEEESDVCDKNTTRMHTHKTDIVM